MKKSTQLFSAIADKTNMIPIDIIRTLDCYFDAKSISKEECTALNRDFTADPGGLNPHLQEKRNISSFVNKVASIDAMKQLLDRCGVQASFWYLMQLEHHPDKKETLLLFCYERLKHKIPASLRQTLAKTLGSAIKNAPKSEETAIYARLYLNADDKTIAALQQMKDGKPAKRLRRTFTHLWSTYCPPCMRELADIIKLSWELYILGAQLDIVAEEPDEGKDAVTAFRENGGIELEKYLRISDGYDIAIRRPIGIGTTQPLSVIGGQGIKQAIYVGTLDIRDKEAILTSVKK